jgi:hypothetical protein
MQEQQPPCKPGMAQARHKAMHAKAQVHMPDSASLAASVTKKGTTVSRTEVAQNMVLYADCLLLLLL